MTSMIRLLLIAFAPLALSACGFALRGEAALPAGLQRATLEVVDAYSPLARDLEAALARAGFEKLAAGTEGVARIRIPVDEARTEVLTVGETARVTEYVVRYTVEIEATAADGRVLLARTPIVLEREFSFDETQALGAQSEQDLIRRELQREMVQQVLRRLEAVR
jgi:LPS-assembly lipoprotein